MSFKITDLDPYLKENFEDEDENTTDVGAEMEKFADVPEEDLEGEEGAIPAEASEVAGEFEMESGDVDGAYYITYDGKPVCSVTILCNGEPQDMATLDNPSECIAEIGGVVDELKSEEYGKKLEEMGFKVEGDFVNHNLNQELPEEPITTESTNPLVDQSMKWMEESV
jgi:hypothetical protein